MRWLRLCHLQDKGAGVNAGKGWTLKKDENSKKRR